MSALLMVFLSIGTLFFGLGVYDMQNRLERWAYERHARD
jgi:hypothetical protein